MIKLNDLDDSNGEQALWINGVPVSQLAKGNPKGVWTFDKFNPGKGGAGIRWDDRAGDREEFSVRPMANHSTDSAGEPTRRSISISSGYTSTPKSPPGIACKFGSTTSWPQRSTSDRFSP